MNFEPISTNKYMVIESKITGKRSIKPASFKINTNKHEVCAYGPTRDSCATAIFFMKPSKHS